MRAYSDLYVDEIMWNQGDAFLCIREQLPGVDEQWFIKAYLQSNMRRLLDHANPKYAAMPPLELVDYFIRWECGGEYQKGQPWWGFLPQWAGVVCSLYQWTYSIRSFDLINLVSFADFERIYPALHQMGWDGAVRKIHDEVIPMPVDKEKALVNAWMDDVRPLLGDEYFIKMADNGASPVVIQ